MKALNYYKTLNNYKSGGRTPYLYFEDCRVLREYKGLFVLNNYVSEYLVYDNVIISERVKISNSLIDDFLDENSTSFDKERMIEAYNQSQIWLNN